MRWLTLALSGAALAAGIAVLLLAGRNDPSSVLPKVFSFGLILTFSVTGGVITWRRTDNTIGWLFSAGSLLWVLGEAALEYAVYSRLTLAASSPTSEWMAWMGGWGRGVGWFLVVAFLLLLFPTGRLPSPRWRPVLWGMVAFLLLFTLGTWLSPTSVDLRLVSVNNPLGSDAAVGVALQDLTNVLSPLVIVAVGSAAIARFRNSIGVERQQLKWFAYAVAIMVILFVVGLTLAMVGVTRPSAALWTVPLVGLPIATGIAIVRYRLYDIDLIINRTLTYGALSATLASLYAGGVVGAGGLIRLIAGEASHDLVVAGSTLAVAALFRPARARIQVFIDRRFYRTKYHAATTLDQFAAKLRHDIGEERLARELLALVSRTVNPVRVSLWLNPGAESSR